MSETHYGSVTVLADHVDNPPAWEMFGGRAEIAATFIGMVTYQAQLDNYPADRFDFDIDSDDQTVLFEIFDSTDNDFIALMLIETV